MRLARASTCLRKIGRDAECEGFASFGFTTVCLWEPRLLPEPETFSSLTLQGSRESLREEKETPGRCGLVCATFEDPEVKGAVESRPNPYNIRRKGY